MSGKGDARFARLQTDPRFRRTKQKNLKVEIDDRFKDVLQSEEFGGKGKGKVQVDKRGRKLGSSHQADQLKHFYRLKSPEAEEGTFVDYARGEGVLESSGSEGEESEIEEEELELGQKKAPTVPRYLKELNEETGSEDEESDDESHLEVNLSEDDEPSAFPDEEDENGDDEEEEEENYADPTKRIAAVNLDWDNLRAGDLFSVFNSFLKPSGKNGESSTSVGKLLSVKIYPSEFGKERLAKEEKEGPGGGIFVSKKGDKKGKGKKREGIVTKRRADEESEEEDEEEYSDEDDIEGSDDEDVEDVEGDSESELEDDREAFEGEDLEVVSDVDSDVDSDAGSEDINMDQLRQYQLERLRYYYAIATFSTVQASMKVLAECNGTEFERTANMFDLTYVPDEMEFDDAEVTDEATKEPKAYKGNDFVTDALRHSKVKLTWDQDDPNRVKMTRRNLTKEEIEEGDFKAYLASSGSEDEDEEDNEAAEASTKAKKGKKAGKEDKDKLRALLLNGDDEDGDVWGKAGLSNGFTSKPDPKGDMEITFRPGLSVSGSGKDEENMTTLEKYQLRMKEKKARKKEKVELKRAAKDDSEPKAAIKEKDDFFGEIDDEESDKESIHLPEDEIPMEEQDEDEDDLTIGKGVEHFSMKDIMKSEKESGKKKRKRNKKSKKGEADEREVELGKEGWKINVKDPRFNALHEEPDFAIDPSNPHFTKTKAMSEMLAERSKRKVQNGDRAPIEKKHAKVDGDVPKEKDLNDLVNSVKRKMGEGSKRVRKRSKK